MVNHTAHCTLIAGRSHSDDYSARELTVEFWFLADEPWDDRRWHHVVWTRTGSGTSTLFLDGKPNAWQQDDGIAWSKHPANPVFTPERKATWEKHKVTACQVIRQGEWYVMFYIGFQDEPTARIGIARSKDGISGWQRHPANPIIRSGQGTWDAIACYKPYAILDGAKWLLGYNGRHGAPEQIGLVTHEGADLGFDRSLGTAR